MFSSKMRLERFVDHSSKLDSMPVSHKRFAPRRRMNSLLLLLNHHDLDSIILRLGKACSRPSYSQPDNSPVGDLRT